MKKAILTLLFHAAVFAASAQDTGQGFGPGQSKIFPDKVIEMLVPLLFLFLLLNMLVAVLKYRAEMRLKEKMVDKGISEEALVEIFGTAIAMQRMQPLKWFLFAAANGLALVLLHFSRYWLAGQSGYLAMGLVLLFNAAAFYVYYRLISKKA
ncbi:MAG: hypothetical protein J5I98_15425 [Phaeodactylibacter sp.]|nr:hypothetical protein [Phaeodactylibacter sp.]